MKKDQGPKSHLESQYSSIFTVFVGPKKSVFFVHSAVICKVSDYFLDNKSAQIITLSYADPSTFDIFLNYIYTGDLPTGYTFNDENHDIKGLVRLYNLCVKLRVSGLLSHIEYEVSHMLLSSHNFSDPSILCNPSPKGGLREIILEDMAKGLFKCIEESSGDSVTKSVTHFLAKGGDDVLTLCKAIAEIGQKRANVKVKPGKGRKEEQEEDSDVSLEEEYDTEKTVVNPHWKNKTIKIKTEK